MLGDDDGCAALVEIGDDGVAVECLVGDKAIEGDAFDQRRHADAVEAVARHEMEADEVAERVGERQDPFDRLGTGLVVMSPLERPTAWL